MSIWCYRNAGLEFPPIDLEPVLLKLRAKSVLPPFCVSAVSEHCYGNLPHYRGSLAPAAGSSLVWLKDTRDEEPSPDQPRGTRHARSSTHCTEQRSLTALNVFEGTDWLFTDPVFDTSIFIATSERNPQKCDLFKPLSEAQLRGISLLRAALSTSSPPFLVRNLRVLYLHPQSQQHTQNLPHLLLKSSHLHSYSLRL